MDFQTAEPPNRNAFRNSGCVMDEELVERVARALHDADWRQLLGTMPDGSPRSWETNPNQDWWRDEARAAIKECHADVLIELANEKDE